MNIDALEEIIKKINLSIFKFNQYLLIGQTQSCFRGHGLQFKEHRPYVHGDDLRFVDWKILARTNTPYIKNFEEERNIEVVAFIDCGPSMLTGYNEISKMQASIEFCCALYLLFEKSKDHLQIFLCDNEITEIFDKSGRQGILALYRKLEKKGICDNQGKFTRNNLTTENIKEKKIKLIRSYLKKKKNLVFFSDFYNFLEINDLENIMINKDNHYFQVLSEIDTLEKLDFAYYASADDNQFGMTNPRRKHDSKVRHKIDKLNKNENWKRIILDDNYINNFLKEIGKSG